MDDRCFIKDPSDMRYCDTCLADISFSVTIGDRCPGCGRLIMGLRDWEEHDESA